MFQIRLVIVSIANKYTQSKLIRYNSNKTSYFSALYYLARITCQDRNAITAMTYLLDEMRQWYLYMADKIELHIHLSVFQMVLKELHRMCVSNDVCAKIAHDTHFAFVISPNQSITIYIIVPLVQKRAEDYHVYLLPSCLLSLPSSYPFPPSSSSPFPSPPSLCFILYYMIITQISQDINIFQYHQLCSMCVSSLERLCLCLMHRL